MPFFAASATSFTRLNRTRPANAKREDRLASTFCELAELQDFVPGKGRAKPLQMLKATRRRLLPIADRQNR